MFKPSILGLGLALAFGPALAAGPQVQWSHVWTYAHDNAGTGQSSEIPAFDAKRRELWVIGGSGLEILGFDGSSRARIDLSGFGTVNSVAIHGNLAAVAIANAVNTDPGVVQFYDVVTRSLKGSVTVGANPDMLVFTPDGERLLVANEGERGNGSANAGVDAEGSVSIIRIRRNQVWLESTATFPGDEAGTQALRERGVRITPGVTANLDIEPEYIALDASGKTATVTLQENNAIANLDIERGRFTQIKGLGMKDFSLQDNWSDLTDRPAGIVAFAAPPAGLSVKGLYQPDSIAAYSTQGRPFYLFANEGDARSDGSDEARASTLGVSGDIGRLTISTLDSSSTDLVAFGGRSFSIRDWRGKIVFDSGNILDVKAHEAGLYDDGRSDNKGAEPEGLAVARIGSRWIAFIGLERTTTSTIALFDITDPEHAQFIDLMTHDGDLGPEGLKAFRVENDTYLAVAHEVSHSTTLYKIGAPKPPR